MWLMPPTADMTQDKVHSVLKLRDFKFVSYGITSKNGNCLLQILKLYSVANKFWLSTNNAYMKNSVMKINKEQ